MPRFNKTEQAESRAALAKYLAGCTQGCDGRPIIYTILKTVSASGMMRRITPFVIVDGAPVSLAWHYERASSGRLADEYGGRWVVRVKGCGMDMGYHLSEGIAYLAGVPAFHHEWI